MTRKKRLGRGLEALLNSTSQPIEQPRATPDVSLPTPEPTYTQAPLVPAQDLAPQEGDVINLNVNEIEDNPFQPRRVFSEAELASLAESLKEHDILQPILVRMVEGRYQLISGERRLRAAIKANWDTIPARIRVADDRLVSELAIVENLQRKDLNPIEKALSFRRYIDEHQCTQDDLAKRLKIDRSTIANLMRLLELPESVKEALQAGQISAGHARALLPLGDESIQNKFCSQILEEGMSVRATEAAVTEWIQDEESQGHRTSTRKRRTSRSRDPHLEALELEIKQALGTQVTIRSGKRSKGQIVIQFTNDIEFERLRRLLTGQDDRVRRIA